MAQRQFRSDDTSTWAEKYGNGSDGTITISSNTTYDGARSSCSGTSGSTSLSIGTASTFANGQVVLIHQTRGTGVGSWELNKISSGGGTTTLTLLYTLTNTYTDSGASQAQVVQLKQYSSVTVNSTYTWSAPAWDGDTGGILAFLCTGITSIAGTISGSGKGYRGGTTRQANGVIGQRGEGSTGGDFAESTTNQGSGGGGGGQNSQGGGGAGGGHANSGTAGQAGSTTGGTAGSSTGNASLTTVFFGGAGGAGGMDGSFNSETSGDAAGGNGAGFIFIASPTITVTGAVQSNGANGTDKPDDASFKYGGGGGAGAGGPILIKGINVTLGSSLVTATGGAGGADGKSNSQPSNGGAGSVGRIHIDYANSFTGTTNPTIDSSLDTTLFASNGGAFFSLLV